VRRSVLQVVVSWVPAGVWAGVLFTLSHQSNPPGASLFPHSDKVAHFGMFGILGATLAWAGRYWRKPLAWAVLVLLGVAFAASDEWHQAFVPARDPSYGDFVADVMGVLVGFFMGKRFMRPS
jgi:VanZ family protein